jgi:hypothetical protein
LFNAHAGDLWRRFTTYLPRRMAALAGISQRQLHALVRIRYVKVAEYQARGVVHFHAIIRLDRTPDAGFEDAYHPPDPFFTAALLCEAIRQAVVAVALPIVPSTDDPGSPARLLTFGSPQGTDVRPIRHSDGLPGTGQALSARAVANYIAKYATKALDAPGLPARPIRSRPDLDATRCSRHYRQMITTAWDLGGGKLTPARSRLCKWAHMLGYGGHFLTKSRHYSVTFGQLRRARAEHRRQQRHPWRTRPLGPPPR